MLKISLVVVGKTTEDYLKTGIAEYSKRLSRFCNFSVVEIPELKHASKISKAEIKKKEAALLMNKISNTRTKVVLLCEGGTQHTSRSFATFIESVELLNIEELVLVIGGAYGFYEDVYKAFPEKISFSRMTFSHQMIRLFVVEQVYRAYSILHNLPYHHD